MEELNLACAIPLMLLLIPVLVLGITQSVRHPGSLSTIGLVIGALLLIVLIGWLLEPIVTEAGRRCPGGVPRAETDPCIAAQRAIVLRSIGLVAMPTVIGVAATLLILHRRDRRQPSPSPSEPQQRAVPNGPGDV